MPLIAITYSIRRESVGCLIPLLAINSRNVVEYPYPRSRSSENSRYTFGPTLGFYPFNLRALVQALSLTVNALGGVLIFRTDRCHLLDLHSSQSRVTYSSLSCFASYYAEHEATFNGNPFSRFVFAPADHYHQARTQ